MSLRDDGLKWLREHYGPPVGPVRVSKYYQADESWNEKPVWWFEFPESTLMEHTSKCIHFLCQQVGMAEPFTHLRVPIDWLRERRQELYIRQDKGVSIYLSAEDGTLYREMRGTGKLDFSEFLQ